MAGAADVFLAAARQTGCLVRTGPDESLDLALCLTALPLPPGRRVAIMTLGGGWGVLAVLGQAAAQHDHRLLPRGTPHDVEEAAAVVDSFKVDEGGRGLCVASQRVEHVERARARLVADRHVLVDTDAAPLCCGDELHPDIAGLGDDAQVAGLGP